MADFQTLFSDLLLLAVIIASGVGCYLFVKHSLENLSNILYYFADAITTYTKALNEHNDLIESSIQQQGDSIHAIHLLLDHRQAQAQAQARTRNQTRRIASTATASAVVPPQEEDTSVLDSTASAA